MSQSKILEILQGLDGHATHKEIKLRAKEKYPTYSLHQYISDRLAKLKKKGKYLIIHKLENGH
jgi:hypothetical protein